MYAKFSISSEGLVEATRKPSCAPCRRKKKKCDGVQPRCSLCRDSYGRDECTWPATRRGRKASTSKEPAEDQKIDEDAFEPCARPEIAELSASTLPDALLQALPELSPEEILQASETFQRVILCNHPSYKKSVLTLSLPLAVEHEPLMHAWISSILLVIPDNAPRWRQKSVLHYDLAVQGLKTAIVAGNPSDEWKRAAVLLCHALELLQPMPSSDLMRSHLRAAHCIFRLATENLGVPASLHDTLLFEGYIVRAAMNCLLQQDMYRKLPFDYMHTLVSMHKRGLDRQLLELNPFNCPWLGATGPEVIQTVYEASWLKVNGLVSRQYSDKALEIRESLVIAGNTDDPTKEPPQHHQPYTVRYAWRSACLALLNNTLSGSDGEVPESEDTIGKGLLHLDYLTEKNCNDVPIIWPLIVFGALTFSHEHYTMCNAIADRFRRAMPSEAVDSIVAFWTQEQRIEQGSSRLADSDLLRAIIL